MNQNHLVPTNTTSVGVDPSELPEGFTAFDPNHGSGNQGNIDDDYQRQTIKEQQRQIILEQAMDGDALARLGRIKMVKPDKAAMVENTIITMAMQGRLPGRISEGKLIEILERGNRKDAAMTASNGQSSCTINIQRKSYAMDSDDDDDDDDDDV
jgi:programmed cell death protein 5